MKKYIFFIVCLLSIHKHIDTAEWTKAMATFEKVEKEFNNTIKKIRSDNSLMLLTSDKTLTNDDDEHLHYKLHTLSSRISMEHLANAFETAKKNGHSVVQIVYDENKDAYFVTPHQTNSFLLPGGVGVLAIIALFAQQEYYRRYSFR